MTHSERNLAQEESHDEITLGHSYVYDRKMGAIEQLPRLKEIDRNGKEKNPSC